MPRGDGTGPFGTGPLNKSGRGTGRGMGRRQGLNRPSGCAGDGKQRISASPGSGNLLTGSLLSSAIKFLGMAAMAVPAMLKARRQLQLPEGDAEHPVIEIKAEPVEEQEAHNDK